MLSPLETRPSSLDFTSAVGADVAEAAGSSPLAAVTITRSVEPDVR